MEEFFDSEYDFENRLLSNQAAPEEEQNEMTLRPQTLLEYEGQEKVKENLYKEFIDKFANSQRLIKKSIMSATLSELPVFFNNISELQDFVYNCLKGCTDMAEKKGCLEIISSMIV